MRAEIVTISAGPERSNETGRGVKHDDVSL